MGDFCEQGIGEIPKQDYARQMKRTNNEIICELSYERREVANKLDKLKAAIDANYSFVSEKHKELWKKQAAAMEEYKRILGERIKDLIGE